MNNICTRAAPAPRGRPARDALRRHVEHAMSALISARRRQIGAGAEQAVIVMFKHDFSIPPGEPWTIVFGWAPERLTEVLNYLDGRRAFCATFM